MKCPNSVAFLAGAVVGVAVAVMHAEKVALMKEQFKEKCKMKLKQKAMQMEDDSDVALEHSVAANDVD